MLNGCKKFWQIYDSRSAALFLFLGVLSATFPFSAIAAEHKDCKDELIRNGYDKNYKDCWMACVNPDLTENCTLGGDPKETAILCKALCCGITPDCPPSTIVPDRETSIY